MVRLHDVLLDGRDDFLKGRNNDAPSVRLHHVSNKSQMKHSTTSQWYVTKTLSDTYPRRPITTSLRRLLEVPNEAPNNVAVVGLHHVSELRCCDGLYIFKLLCHELNLVGFHVSFKY